MPEKREAKQGRNKTKEPVRLISLSDGLFATVLTVLVLDLRLPDAVSGSNGNVDTFVTWLGPHLFSYVLTFLVAGTYWLAHHRDFDHIVQYDRQLLGYNLLFLFFIGLFPFSTAAVSQAHFTTETFPFYWAIYGANIISAGVMQTLTWLYAVDHGLLGPEVTQTEIRHITLRHVVTPAVFLLSIAMEYLIPQTSVGPFTLLVLPVLLSVVNRRFRQPETANSRQVSSMDGPFMARGNVFAMGAPDGSGDLGNGTLRLGSTSNNKSHRLVIFPACDFY